MGRNLTIIASLALAAGLVSCKGPGAEVPAGRLVAAGPAKLRDAVRLSGTVKPVVQVDLKAEVSGRIEKLPAKEGDLVKKGQLLVQLDPEPFQLKVDRAKLVVDRARLALATTTRDVSRAKTLLATGTVSSDAVDDLVTARSKAELDLRDAQLQLRESSKDLAGAFVRAPMDGQLITLNVEEGEMAASAVSLSGGTALGVVADPSRMKVEVEVGELDFARLRLGMPVEVSTGSEGARPLKGKVTFISSSARASSASTSIQVFPVEVTLNSGAASDGRTASRRGGADKSSWAGKGSRRGDSSTGETGRAQAAGLGAKAAWLESKRSGKADTSAKGQGASELVAGVTVGVDFVFMEREVPLAVPQAALVKGKESTVQVKGADGKISTRTVRAGATDFRHVEILDGLVAGDSVLVPETSAKKSSGPGGR